MFFISSLLLSILLLFCSNPTLALDFSQTKLCSGNVLCTLDCSNCNLCSPDVCSLENNCFCPSKKIPGNIPLDQTPQFFFLTFDDSVQETHAMNLLTKLNHWRQNPLIKDKNGCSVRPTIYSMNIFSDFGFISYLDKIGEVSLHSTTHTTSFQSDLRKFRNEMYNLYSDLAELSQVIPKGSRAPYLQTNDNYFSVLKELNIKYDSSSVYYAKNYNPGNVSAQVNWWPFTLDFGYPEMSIGYTSALDLKNRVPGLWEFPMIGYQYQNGDQYEAMDYTISPTFMDDFKRDFETNYNTNRAPLGIYFHAYYFVNDEWTGDNVQLLQVYSELLQWVVSHDNVLFATPSRVINWIKDPKPFSETILSPDFACPSPSITPENPCNEGVSKKTCTINNLALNTCQDQCPTGSFSFNICGDKCPDQRPDIDVVWKYEDGKPRTYLPPALYFDPVTRESNQNYFRFDGKVDISWPINGTMDPNTGKFGLNGWFCANLIINNPNSFEGATGLILTVDSCSVNSRFTSFYGYPVQLFNQDSFTGFRMIGKNIQIMKYTAITAASFCMAVNENGVDSFDMSYLKAGVDLFNQTLTCDLEGNNPCQVRCGNKILDSGESSTNCPVDVQRTCPRSRLLSAKLGKKDLI